MEERRRQNAVQLAVDQRCWRQADGRIAVSSEAGDCPECHAYRESAPGRTARVQASGGGGNVRGAGSGNRGSNGWSG